MKLHIRRNQRKIAFGGFRFVVSFSLEVSQEETELIKKYGQDKRKIGGVSDVWGGDTLEAFRRGVKNEEESIEYDADNVLSAIAVEQAVKRDFERLRDYLAVASSYGGAEILNI